MLPTINVHRPRGVLPKVSLRKRTVVDYQPSWLLLAVPALALAARRRSSQQDGDESSTHGRRSGAEDSGPTESSPPAQDGRRRRRVLIISAVRRRRKGVNDEVASVTPGATNST
ncbi:hypothetical protein BH24ACT10_BH24ACT10_10650 [soil metagenome]